MIPAHLDHLPRWKGLPVPFINIWSDEADEHAITHGPDATVMMDGWYTTGQQGVGVPDFTAQCPQRQRLCAVYGLCQVCRGRLDDRERNLILLGTKTRIVDGRERPLVGEPFICDGCLDYVLNICPGVRRSSPRVLRVTSWQLSVETQWHDDYGPDIPAAMWVNVIPLAGRTIRPGAAPEA